MNLWLVLRNTANLYTCSGVYHFFWIQRVRSKIDAYLARTNSKHGPSALLYYISLLCIVHGFHNNTCAEIRIVSFRQECSNICIDILEEHYKNLLLWTVCSINVCFACYKLYSRAILCTLYLNLCFFRSFYQFIGSYTELCCVSCLVSRVPCRICMYFPSTRYDVDVE